MKLTTAFAAVIAVTAVVACNDNAPEAPGETKLTGIIDQVDLSSPLCAERADGRTIKMLVRPDGYDKEGHKLPLRIVCISRAELNQGDYEKGKRYP